LTPSVHPAGEEFKQDTKVIVKVKFIRKGTHFKETERGVPEGREPWVRF
jgi:hypothetical protein